MNDENNVKRVIPMIMLVFISSATMISVINIISPQLTVDFGISPTTVSLLSMTVMLMMGVASVAYSTLSDYLSIRRLMIFGVCLLDVGAVMGFLAAGRSFYMLLGASALMITGGTCGSGLMIILVSRYIGEREHARYYGFNTACVSISQASGILLGGFFATYIGWKYAFLIPLVSLAALPSICRYVPDERLNQEGRLDIAGLVLLVGFTFLISMYFNMGSMGYLLLSMVVLAVFFIYISKSGRAFINMDFFRNRNYVTAILLVALTFGIQNSFSFLFPFMAQGIYQVTLDKVSLILLPSYVFAAVIAMNSGRIVTRFKSFRTLCGALILVAAALAFGALGTDRGVLALGICACLFAGGFALVYAPFMEIVISTLAPEQVGVGIGFFNLMTSIGPSLLITLTGRMMSARGMAEGPSLAKGNAGLYSNILLVFMAVLLVVFIILRVKKNDYLREDQK